MPRLAAHSRSLAASLVLAALVAAPWAAPRPAVPGPNAPPERFSAARVLPLVEALAREPRPAGSEASARARERLRLELEALGLAVGEQHFRSERVPDAVLVNLVVRVPGSAPSGAVLLMAHHDSVRRSPGAGDDAAGVAAALEALRAFLARGAPRNDLVLLLSDGEERGLLGARAFAAEHPWARDVRLVINLDAIGNAGPAALFETGERNGQVVRAVARGVRAPVGGSFASAVYGSMPNDTDYSVFRDRGVPGANLALTGNGRAYHAWFDTPERLDPRGLQHMGEQTLELLAEFDALDLAGAQGEPRHWVSLPGGRLLHMPAAWTPPLAWSVGALLLVACALAWWRVPPGPAGRGAPLLLSLGLVLGLSLAAALLSAGVTAAGLLAFGGWREPAEPTAAWQVSLRLFLSVLAGSLVCTLAAARLARGPRGRRILSLLPAAGALIWIALLLLLARTLGPQALPLAALSALPTCAAILHFGRRPLALSLPLVSVLLAAQTVQGVNQVSSTSPTQETILSGVLVGLGLALLVPWTARLALTPRSDVPRSAR